MSVSYPLMLLEALGFFPGILFWTGLLLGIIPQLVLGGLRRNDEKHTEENQKSRRSRKVGILTFGSNKYAIAADNTMAVSFVLTVLLLILTKGMGWICYFALGAFCFSFCMHCLLNGRNYLFIQKKKTKTSLIKKTAQNMGGRDS